MKSAFYRSPPRQRLLLPLACTAMLHVAMVSTALSANAADQANPTWSQFRGPSGQGTSLATNVPVEFGLERGMKWQTPIQGKGWSSPVVAGGHVWLTTGITTDATPEEREQKLAGVQMRDQKEVVGAVTLRAICLDLETGSIVRNLELATFEDPELIHPLNSFASPTPCVDGDKVYCHFGSYGTWCLDDASGEIIWTKRLVVDHSVGPGGSPVIAGKLLLLVCDGIDAQFVAALDKQTGAEVWRTPRPPMRATNGEFQKAYSTPLVIDVNSAQQAVIPGAQWIVAYDPGSGKELWRADHGNGFSISSTPVYTGTSAQIGLVIFTTGYGQKEVVAVRPDGKGDVTFSHIQWRSDHNVPAKPSPISSGERVYLIDDNGVLSCLQASDATTVFRKRVAGNYSASPLLVAGHLYFSSQEGVVTVIRDTDQYEEVSKTTLDGRLMASPAVVGDDLLFRSENSLMRFTNKKVVSKKASPR